MKNSSTGNNVYIALYQGDYFTTYITDSKEIFSTQIVLGYVQGTTKNEAWDYYRLLLEYKFFLDDEEIKKVVESTKLLEIASTQSATSTKEYTEEDPLPF